MNKKILKKIIKEILLENPISDFHDPTGDNETEGFGIKRILYDAFYNTKENYFFILISNEKCSTHERDEQDFFHNSNILRRDIKSINGIKISDIDSEKKIIVLNKKFYDLILKKGFSASSAEHFLHDIGHTALDKNKEKKIFRLGKNISDKIFEHFSKIPSLEKDRMVFFNQWLEDQVHNYYAKFFQIYNETFGPDDQLSNIALKIILFPEKIKESIETERISVESSGENLLDFIFNLIKTTSDINHVLKINLEKNEQNLKESLKRDPIDKNINSFIKQYLDRYLDIITAMQNIINNKNLIIFLGVDLEKCVLEKIIEKN